MWSTDASNTLFSQQDIQDDINEYDCCYFGNSTQLLWSTNDHHWLHILLILTMNLIRNKHIQITNQSKHSMYKTECNATECVRKFLFNRCN